MSSAPTNPNTLNTIEAKRIEVATSQQMKNLVAIFQNSPDLFYISDLAGLFQQVNPTWQKILGYTATDLVSQNLLQLTHPDDYQLTELQLANLLTGETSAHWENRCLGENQEYRWIEWTVTLAPDEQLVYGIGRDISNNKQQIQEYSDLIIALQARMQRYRATFEQAVFGIAHVNVRGEWLNFNQKLCQILGYEQDELTALNFMAVVNPEDQQHLFTSQFSNTKLEEEELLFTGELEKISKEVRLVTKEKQQIWVNLTISLVKTSGGYPLNWLVMIEDISDRLELSQKLAQQQVIFDNFFQYSPAGLAIYNRDLQYVRVNHALAQITNYPASQYLGKTTGEIFPAINEQILSAQQAILTSGQPILNMEISGQVADTPDKSWYWLASYFPLPDGDGQLAGLGSIILDITERKRAEQELQAKEEKFRMIVDFTFDWEYWVSPSGEMLYVSPSCARVTGYQPQDFMNDADFLLKIIVPEDQTAVRPYLQDLGTQQVENLDFRLITKDKQIRWISHSCQPVYNDAGVFLGRRASNRDITDRKSAELATVKLTQHLENAQRIAHVGIWEYDVTNQNIIWSKELFNIIGILPRTPAPSVQELFLMIHPEDRYSWLHNVEKSLATGQSYQTEHRILKPDGKICYVNGQGETIRSKKGQVLRFFETVMDITDRKQREIRLEEQTKFLRSIYEKVEYVIFIIEVKLLKENPLTYDYVLWDWNPAGEKLAGIPAEKIQGKPIEIILDPDDVVNVRQNYDRCLQENQSIAYEERLNLGGKKVWMLTTISPVRDESTLVTRIVGTSINITKRKETEFAWQQLEAKLTELIEQETLQNQITNLIRNSLELDTILATTVEEVRKLLEVDRTYFLSYKTSEDHQHSQWQILKEAKADDLESITEIYPDDSLAPLTPLLLDSESLCLNNIADCPVESMKNIFLVLNYQSVLILPLIISENNIGALVLAHTRYMRPWLDREIKLLQTVTNQLAIAINQSELYMQTKLSEQLAIQKSQELADALQKLQLTQTQLVQAEKMSSLGQLVAGIAHEINNPVSFIYGNLFPAQDYVNDLLGLLNLYQSSYPQPPDQIAQTIEQIELDFVRKDLLRLLQSMKHGADRIRDIVKSLRTFSHLDEAEMKEIDLHENLDSTLMILQSRLKEQPKHPEIEVVKQYAKLPFVECYAGQLNQVFLHILANSIDAIESYRQDWSIEQLWQDPGKIWISTDPMKGDRVQLKISDNGGGMKPEIVSKIFDPFYTTKPVGTGTGLGLSISYQVIVDKHHGSLRCVSQVGIGTEFIIEMPQKQTSE
jgi:two-component system NtrC family sensor kinase